MKLTHLLTQRQALLRQARLANLAFAHAGLSDFARRIARGGLRGEVRLQQAEPGAERYWASLTALQGNQSVIEEHLTDQDLMDLADVIAYATGETNVDLTFRIEDLAGRFLGPLRRVLAQGGVTLDPPEPDCEASGQEGPSGHSHADETG